MCEQLIEFDDGQARAPSRGRVEVDLNLLLIFTFLRSQSLSLLLSSVELFGGKVSSFLIIYLFNLSSSFRKLQKNRL